MMAYMPQTNINPVKLVVALTLTLLINVPFGYWRAYARNNNRKIEWIMAVHAPVPLIVMLRKWVEIMLSLDYIVAIIAFVVMYFVGQRLGGKIYTRLASSGCIDTSRNLLYDVVKFQRLSPCKV